MIEKIELWTIGRINASPTTELDKRVEELIQIRDSLTRGIQAELDFIYDVVAHRESEGKA